MDLKKALREFQYLFREKGLRATCRSLMDRIGIRWFEWRFDIRSEAVIELKEFGIENELYRPYVATDYRSFRKVLDELPIRPGVDGFLDFGCGMGRAVILAATHPFRKAYGVEIALRLSEVARENVRHALPRLKCRDIEIITADATQFAIPHEVTVIYFFNPFCGEVLTRVLENVRESLRRNPRPLRLVCKVPAKSAFEEEIRRHRWLVQEREIVFDMNNRYLFLAAKD